MKSKNARSGLLNGNPMGVNIGRGVVAANDTMFEAALFRGIIFSFQK
jgi:hypothetical protein